LPHALVMYLFPKILKPGYGPELNCRRIVVSGKLLHLITEINLQPVFYLKNKNKMRHSILPDCFVNI